jgi:hypothetical protein
MVNIQEAIERAKLSAGEDGLLSQYTYNQLLDNLSDDDRYAFTSALLERGILVRAKNKNLKVNCKKGMLRLSQQFKESPGGLWVPEDWKDDDDLSDLADIADDDVTTLTEEDIEEMWTPEEYSEFEDIESIRKTLEDAGISVSPEGGVSFYNFAIPGVYKEKLPMKELDIDRAYGLMNQKYNIGSKERQKIQTLQDILTRIGPQLEAVEDSINDLDNTGFSSSSTNTQIKNIADGLVGIREALLSGDWKLVSPVLDQVKDDLDVYSQGFYESEEDMASVVDALGRIKDIKENQPEKFEQLLGGYGGLAAMRKQHQFDYGYDEEPSEVVGDVTLIIGEDYIRELIDRYLYDSYNQGDDTAYETVTDMMVGDIDSDIMESLVGAFSADTNEASRVGIDGEFNIEIKPGYEFEAIGTTYKKEEADPSVGYGGGWTKWDEETIDDSPYREALETDVKFITEEM